MCFNDIFIILKTVTKQILMTCFWNGLLSRLNIYAINKYLNCNLNDKPEPREFVQLLKNNAVVTPDVKCGILGDTALTRKQLEENLEWILNYNVDGVHNGHDCSTCDPFLLLVSQLFMIDIHHNYNNFFVKYVNAKNKCGYILSLSSDKGHLW